MVASLPIPDEVTESHWASRAWTFQEQLLSKRFLIFRGGQVFWQCPSRVLFEDTATENKIGVTKRLRQIPLSWSTKEVEPFSVTEPLNPGPLYRSDIFLEYSSVVTEYSKKKLTYPDDVLRVFEGFSRILERQFDSRFSFGLPESYLDVALLWIPLTVLKRRLGVDKTFPSWSWCGWIGEVGYEDTGNSRLERVVP